MSESWDFRHTSGSTGHSLVPPPSYIKKQITEMTNEKGNPVLKERAQRICLLLKERKPRRVEGVPAELHPLPPFIDKTSWADLGNAIKDAERPTFVSVPGDRWISLRCDGTGFSKQLRRLRKHGVFCEGYSDAFAEIMVRCCHDLMEKFNAKCAYTQSDEMTILVAPTSVIRGEREPHLYSGRVQKLCSLAAALVTSRFNYQVMKLCNEAGVEYLPELVATFDCRVGVYSTQEEALSLILWRAYDCNINGTQGAVYFQKGKVEGAGKACELPGDARLRWLNDNSLLPLCPHERDGTYLVKRKRAIQGVNQKTGKEIIYLRSKVEQVSGNVLQLFQDGKLFPPDEELSADEL